MDKGGAKHAGRGQGPGEEFRRMKNMQAVPYLFFDSCTLLLRPHFSIKHTVLANSGCYNEKTKD